MASSERDPTHFDDCPVHGRYQRATKGPDGTVRWLPACPFCARDAEMTRILGRAAIPPRFQKRSFDDYEAISAGQKAALAITRAYAESFDEQIKSGRCLILCGKPGTGKTHLATAILNHLVAAGRFGLYATVIEAVRRVKDTWGKGVSERERDALFSFVRPDLLVLDEVGVQFNSESERLILFEIINSRYGQVRPTILIANQDIAGIEESIGFRALDRLREGGGRVVVFNWDSHRKAA